MNIYQKIAIFLFRITGVAFFLYGFVGWFYYVTLLTFIGFPIDGINITYVLFSAVYFILGIALLLFSGPLGKLLGKGLDDNRDDE